MEGGKLRKISFIEKEIVIQPSVSKYEINGLWNVGMREEGVARAKALQTGKEVTSTGQFHKIIEDLMFFYRSKHSTFRELSKGDYRLDIENNSAYLIITNPKILEYEKLQVVSTYDFNASNYKTEFNVDINTLNARYNELVTSTARLWNIIKQQGMIGDSLDIDLILPPIQDGEIWVRRDDHYEGISLTDAEGILKNTIDNYIAVYKAEIERIKQGHIDTLKQEHSNITQDLTNATNQHKEELQEKQDSVLENIKNTEKGNIELLNQTTLKNKNDIDTLANSLMGDLGHKTTELKGQLENATASYVQVLENTNNGLKLDLQSKHSEISGALDKKSQSLLDNLETHNELQKQKFENYVVAREEKTLTEHKSQIDDYTLTKLSLLNSNIDDAKDKAINQMNSSVTIAQNKAIDKIDLHAKEINTEANNLLTDYRKQITKDLNTAKDSLSQHKGVLVDDLDTHSSSLKNELNVIKNNDIDELNEKTKELKGALETNKTALTHDMRVEMDNKKAELKTKLEKEINDYTEEKKTLAKDDIEGYTSVKLQQINNTIQQATKSEMDKNVVSAKKEIDTYNTNVVNKNKQDLDNHRDEITSVLESYKTDAEANLRKEAGRIMKEDFTQIATDYLSEHKDDFKGIRGYQGITFTPHIEDNMLSWTNDGELENPTPINVKGDKGDKGEKGEQGIQGIQGERGEAGVVDYSRVTLKRKMIGDIDYNELLEDGLYCGYRNLQNSAISTISVTDIKNYTNDWIVQKQYPMLNDGKYREYSRIKYAGKTWSDWVEIWHSGNFNLQKLQPIAIESNVGNHVVLKRSGELKGSLTANQDGVAIYNEKSKKMVELKDDGSLVLPSNNLISYTKDIVGTLNKNNGQWINNEDIGDIANVNHVGWYSAQANTVGAPNNSLGLINSFYDKGDTSNTHHLLWFDKEHSGLIYHKVGDEDWVRVATTKDIEGVKTEILTHKDEFKGVAFVPSISDGMLTWTNDGNLPNPDPVRVKGEDGRQGVDGKPGKDASITLVIYDE